MFQDLLIKKQLREEDRKAKEKREEEITKEFVSYCLNLEDELKQMDIEVSTLYNTRVYLNKYELHIEHTFKKLTIWYTGYGNSKEKEIPFDIYANKTTRFKIYKNALRLAVSKILKIH